MVKPVLIQYLEWHFIDSSGAIISAWKNFALFYLHHFSMPTLFRTFFSHWHKMYYPYPKGWEPKEYFANFVFNMMSRIIGAILRTIFIIWGVLSEVMVFFFGLIIFLGWLILPLLLILGLIFGVKLILV